MPLFKRRPADFAAPVGTLPCCARGCANTTAITCAYTDRHGRSCSTAFCPDHWSAVGGVVYCRRHAGTIAALGENAATMALPELNNRAASLVSWIADGIDEDVTRLLGDAARRLETVKREAEVAMVLDVNRRRRWERSWKLIESTGISLKVSLQVSADSDDALIEARVGSYVVARGVPPWIARRRAGVEVSDQVDTEQRELFRSFLVDHIAEEITQQRAEEEAERNRLLR